MKSLKNKFFPPKIIIKNCPSWISKKHLREQILKIHQKTKVYSQVQQFHLSLLNEYSKAGHFQNPTCYYVPGSLGLTYINFNSKRTFQTIHLIGLNYGSYQISQIDGPNHIIFQPTISLFPTIFSFSLTYYRPFVNFSDISNNFQYPWFFLDAHYNFNPFFSTFGYAPHNSFFLRFQFQSSSKRNLLSLGIRSVLQNFTNNLGFNNYPLPSYFQPPHLTVLSLSHRFLVPKIPWALSLYSEAGLLFKTYTNLTGPQTYSIFSDLSQSSNPYFLFEFNNERKIGKWEFVFDNSIIFGSKKTRIPLLFFQYNFHEFFQKKNPMFSNKYLDGIFHHDQISFIGVNYNCPKFSFNLFHSKFKISFKPELFFIGGLTQTKYQEFFLFNSPKIDAFSALGGTISTSSPKPIHSENPQKDTNLDLYATASLNFSTYSSIPSFSFLLQFSDIKTLKFPLT